MRTALQGYYAAISGSFLPTYRDDVLVPSSRVRSPNKGSIFLGFLKMGPIGLPDTSVRNSHYLCNNPEEHSSRLFCGGIFKSCAIHRMSLSLIVLLFHNPLVCILPNLIKFLLIILSGTNVSCVL